MFPWEHRLRNKGNKQSILQSPYFLRGFCGQFDRCGVVITLLVNRDSFEVAWFFCEVHTCLAAIDLMTDKGSRQLRDIAPHLKFRWRGRGLHVPLDVKSTLQFQINIKHTHINAKLPWYIVLCKNIHFSVILTFKVLEFQLKLQLWPTTTFSIMMRFPPNLVWLRSIL